MLACYVLLPMRKQPSVTVQQTVVLQCRHTCWISVVMILHTSGVLNDCHGWIHRTISWHFLGLIFRDELMCRICSCSTLPIWRTAGRVVLCINATVRTSLDATRVGRAIVSSSVTLHALATPKRRSVLQHLGMLLEVRFTLCKQLHSFPILTCAISLESESLCHVLGLYNAICCVGSVWVS